MTSIFRFDTPAQNGSVNSEVVWSVNETYSTVNYANQAAKVRYWVPQVKKNAN